MTIQFRFTIGLCVCGLALFYNGTADAQLGIEWVARYNGPGNDWDAAEALAIDDSGNIYVTGRSRGSGTGFDYATLKYSPTGDTLWVRRYNGPGNGDDIAFALAVDTDGNVIVTGVSAGIGTADDYATIKYTPDGDTVWVRRYNGAANSADTANALVVDDSGNVYVTGGSDGGDFLMDYTTIKYSPLGDTHWLRQYNGTDSSTDIATAIALDDSGNVIITGRSNGFPHGTADYTTVKYSPSGDMLWVQRYNGPGNDWDAAEALTLDGSGNVLVTGNSTDSATSSDFATIKYAPNGNLVWVRRYNGPGNGFDDVSSLAVDHSGNVYVGGGGAQSQDSPCDFVTIKYSSAGATLWVRTYDGLDHGDEYVLAMGVDANGNVCVTGDSWVNEAGPDYATIKYSSIGDTLWIRRYDGSGKGPDLSQALAIDDGGDVFVSGLSWGSGTRLDYATLKYVDPVGDVTCDGVIDLADLVLLGNFLDGLINLTNTCGGGQADVDRDGDIDEVDYNMLYDAIAGLGP